MVGHLNDGKLFTLTPEIYFEGIGGLGQLGTNFDSQRIPKAIPHFYRQLLTTWTEYTS